MEEFKYHLSKAIAKSGMKKRWLADQLNIERTTFWRKTNKASFTKLEKAKLYQLLNYRGYMDNEYENENK